VYKLQQSRRRGGARVECMGDAGLGKGSGRYGSWIERACDAAACEIVV